MAQRGHRTPLWCVSALGLNYRPLRFVNAVRGREKITHTNFEDGVRYMEFTDAVAKSYASGQAVDVKDL